MSEERRIPAVYRAMLEDPMQRGPARSAFWRLGALVFGALAYAGCGGPADDLGGLGEDLGPMGWGGSDQHDDDPCYDDDSMTGTSTGYDTRTDTTSWETRDCDTTTGDSSHDSHSSYTGDTSGHDTHSSYTGDTSGHTHLGKKPGKR